MSENFKIILFFFFQVIFLSTISAASIQVEIPEPDATVHEIMDDTIDILEKKYNLNPCGIGMNGKFEYLEISFQMRKNLKKEEVRRILLDCTDIFLQNINSCEKIRPFLKEYPFTNKNTGIVIFIYDENNNDIFHPEICDAGLEKGKISYHTQSKENLFRYKETYEEALALINEQKQQLAQQNPNE